MSGPVDAIFDLAEHVAKKISEKTGVAEAITFPIAKAAAKEYAAQQRRATTAAREDAIAKAKRAGRERREG